MEVNENIFEYGKEIVTASYKKQLNDNKVRGKNGGGDQAQDLDPSKSTFDRIRKKYLKNIQDVRERAKLITSGVELHQKNEEEFQRRTFRNDSIVNVTHMKYKSIRMENAQLEDINKKIIKENRKLNKDFNDCMKFIDVDVIKKKTNQNLIITLLEKQIKDLQEDMANAKNQQLSHRNRLKGECAKRKKLISAKRHQIRETKLEIEKTRSDNATYSDLCKNLWTSQKMIAKENRQLLDNIEQNESKYFKNLLYQSIKLENELTNYNNEAKAIDYATVLEKTRQYNDPIYEDLRNNMIDLMTKHKQISNDYAALQAEYENMRKLNQSIDCYIRTNRIK